MDTQDNKNLKDSQETEQVQAETQAEVQAEPQAEAVAQQPAQPAAQQPAAQQPAAQQPAQATYQQPVYQQPAQAAYQQPAQPVYQQPAYQQPVYQQPGQPVYQQPGQPVYQQPVYQQPAQPVYVQPVAQPVVQAPVMAAASEAEKSAYFLSGGSIFMLIFAIVGTINLLTSLIGDFMSLSIGGILGEILTLLMVIGYWLVYANCKGKKLKTTGISLIRIPYVIAFVFSVIGFVGTFLLYCISLNVVGIIVQLLVFIFECICFSSVNKTLKMARDINRNQSVFGRKAGSFAAIIMIISGVFTLIGDIVSSLMYALLAETIESLLGEGNVLSSLLSTGGTLSIVVAVIAFITSICAALVLLKFGNLIKKAHGEA